MHRGITMARCEAEKVEAGKIKAANKGRSSFQHQNAQRHYHVALPGGKGRGGKDQGGKQGSIFFPTSKFTEALPPRTARQKRARRERSRRQTRVDLLCNVRKHRGIPSASCEAEEGRWKGLGGFKGFGFHLERWKMCIARRLLQPLSTAPKPSAPFTSTMALEFGM
eukprot:366294-Chlamydomonas_euryale.AAC.5